MTIKPTSNSPAEMQKWARWVDSQVDKLKDGDVPSIKSKLDKMDANDLRYQQQISTLQYQLKYLTDLIKSSASFDSLSLALNNAAPIETLTPIDTTPAPTSVTVTFTASGSASWAGSNLVTGTGEFTDAKMMYQGTSAGSKKVSSFWFSQADLATVASKTITSASIYVKNRHFYYNSGGDAYFAPHAHQTAVLPTATTNNFDEPFKYGEGKWVSLSPSVYNGISGGSVKGFSLGILASSNVENYGYFDGALKASPPKLRITYSN
jgi:hypothetical protein